MKPVEVYKQIIDQLVQRSHSLGAQLVTKEGIYSKAPAFRHTNDLVCALTPEQRVVLAEMLTHERESAIHDVLAALTWWIECREVGLTYQGKPMPTQLSEMGLHGDYIGRRDDWEWPNDEKTA
jgi:hypothetical protein